jgi:phospholipase/lecithinase/hemolysin
LPPYKAYNGSFNKGANFAVGGATAINVEYFEKNGYVKFNMIRDSLDHQLAWFQELKTSLCNSTEGINYTLSKFDNIWAYLQKDWSFFKAKVNHILSLMEFLAGSFIIVPYYV